MIKGTSIVEKTENCRLCALTTLKLQKDIDDGKDIEFIFAGTSEKKLIEYVFKDGSLIKVKEIDTSHKKSIFGIATLDEKTLISSGLDGKIMIHEIEHATHWSPKKG